MQKGEYRAEAILAAAEQRVRRAGYRGFSFRDLAGDVGVKSASVHYHFPNKGDLAARLVQRYRLRTLKALGSSQGCSARQAVERLAALFVEANETHDLMCLCCLLGAESDALPRHVVAEVADYFAQLCGWLETAFGPDHKGLGAQTVVAALEGALVIARTRRDPEVLRRCAREIAARC